MRDVGPPPRLTNIVVRMGHDVHVHLALHALLERVGGGWKGVSEAAKPAASTKQKRTLWTLYFRGFFFSTAAAPHETSASAVSTKRRMIPRITRRATNASASAAVASGALPAVTTAAARSKPRAQEHSSGGSYLLTVTK